MHYTHTYYYILIVHIYILIHHMIHIICSLDISVTLQNVSCGANGLLPVISDDGVPLEPIKLPFSQFQDGLGPLCPANVHFHIGAEHSSDGEYDTSFDFKDFSNGPEYNTTNFPRDKEYSGKRCNFYKNRETNGLNFENKFQWKYCVDVKVGTFWLLYLVLYMVYILFHSHISFHNSSKYYR